VDLPSHLRLKPPKDINTAEGVPSFRVLWRSTFLFESENTDKKFHGAALFRARRSIMSITKTTWPTGRSGNARGRPRSGDELGAILHQTVDRKRFGEKLCELCCAGDLREMRFLLQNTGRQGQRRDLQAQAQLLVSAIAKSGDSPSRLSVLAAVESALAQLDQQLKAHSPFDLESCRKSSKLEMNTKDCLGAMVEMRKFVSENLLQLRMFLARDPASAKGALSKHIKQLVLTPEKLATGPELEVSGKVDLVPNNDDAAGSAVMLVAAKDGIAQHYPGLTIPLAGVDFDPRSIFGSRARE
jgi:hypothetical protein